MIEAHSESERASESGSDELLRVIKAYLASPVAQSLRLLVVYQGRVQLALTGTAVPPDRLPPTAISATSL